jgi:nucleotide-binding universal stress UspA family protein
MPLAELEKTHSTAVFHRILVATDFSGVSRRALADALAIASHDNACVCVIHAVTRDPHYRDLERPPELDTIRLEAERQMRDFVGDLDAEHRIDAIYLPEGNVADAVSSVVKEDEIDLLVIGTRGRGGLEKLALGSVAEELLRVAPCPVLTIGPQTEDSTTTERAGFRRILFATDFGKAAGLALPLALSLAGAHRAKLTLLHMIPPMPASSGSLTAFSPPGAAAEELIEWEASMRKLSLRRLQECLPAETGLEEEPECRVGTDFSPEGILVAAEECQADLIVMGANHKASARVAAHFPWATVHEVVRAARCPVLTMAG